MMLDKSKTPQEKGREILYCVQNAIQEAASGDADAWFLINRFVWARLKLDEDAPKDEIKAELFERHPKCSRCEKPFDSIKGVELHRLNKDQRYHEDNCVLLCKECHQSIGRKRTWHK